MDTNQAKVIELLREVHLIASTEIERLNLRIAELEIRLRESQPPPTAKRSPAKPPADIPQPCPPKPDTALLNEQEVAAYLHLSVASVRRWRLFRTGPKYLKIGAAVRYKSEDVDAWVNSRPSLR